LVHPVFSVSFLKDFQRRLFNTKISTRRVLSTQMIPQVTTDLRQMQEGLDRSMPQEETPFECGIFLIPNIKLEV